MNNKSHIPWKLWHEPEPVVVAEDFEEVTTTTQVETVSVWAGSQYWSLKRFCAPHIKTDRQTYRQTDRHIDTQRERRTDTQTERQRKLWQQPRLNPFLYGPVVNTGVWNLYYTYYLLYIGDFKTILFSFISMKIYEIVIPERLSLIF